MQTPAKFCFCFAKVNTQQLFLWSANTTSNIISDTSPNTKILFSRLSVQTPKIITFLTKTLPKLHAIKCYSIAIITHLFFTILVARNKQNIYYKFVK